MDGMEMRAKVAFLGFHEGCARLVQALSSSERTVITGILAKSLPRGWPPSVSPPPLFTSKEEFFREADPDIVLMARETKGLKEPPPGCQIIDVREGTAGEALLEGLIGAGRAGDEGGSAGMDLQEIASICASVNVVEAYSDPLPKLTQLLDRAVVLSGADAGMVLFPGQEMDTLRVVLARGKGTDKLPGRTLLISSSVSGASFDSGAIVQKVLTPELEESELLEEAEVSMCLSLPLRAEGRVNGVLSLGRKEGAFDIVRMPLLTLIADQAGLAILIARLYSELETNVITDSVSGLYNRNYFHQRLHEEICRARRYSLNVCLVMLEIDNFEAYVKRNGRFMGEFILSDVGNIIRRNTREVDTAARYDGHLFALLLPETRRLGAVRLAERIRKVMEEYPFPSRERKEVEKLTICAGIASYPANAANEQELVERAQIALKSAKEEGPSSIRLYSGDLGAESA